MASLRAYLWLLAALALSGLLLMLLYVPSAASQALPASGAGVSAGPALRGVHFWAAHLAVLALLVHLGRTIFVKTSRPHVGWVAALVLLTCLLWFTGYLLPWDQLAFWMQGWLHGISTQAALWTVYWTHTLALSVMMLAVLTAYVRRTRRDPAMTTEKH